MATRNRTNTVRPTKESNTSADRRAGNGEFRSIFVVLSLIGREPGPGLRMFSVKFFSLSFLVNLYHRKFIMTTPNSGPFALRGPKSPFSGIKLCIFKYCVAVTSEMDLETAYLAESIFR